LKDYIPHSLTELCNIVLTTVIIHLQYTFAV